ncbi:hypothetical protein EON80_03010 [bacterium]|nr:MAG: hypothetical protein EON80_03010 [bacterium]
MTERRYWVYILSNASKTLYIGVTGNLERRIYQHKNNYSENYLRSVQSILETNDLSRVGVSLLAPEEFQTVYNKNTWYNTLGHYLYLMQNDISVIGLNDLEIPLSTSKTDRDIEETNLAFGVFMRFADRQKQAGNFISAAQSQVDFIRQHRINFMITQQGANISPGLQKLIKRSVTDPVSGEVFHLLKIAP